MPKTSPPALAAGLIGVCLTLTATPADAAPRPVTSVEGITEYELPNGFRFLLFPDPSKPVVTVNLTVLVGSRHEGYGESGMAHLLEHMVFKGTPTFPDVPKALRDHGARFNGTTWVDRTNYFETMPATDENLEFGVRLEADRLVNSLIRREDLLSEFTVVRSEFERGENDPAGVLGQRMMAAAFEWHNYGKSTIGNRSDIERVPVENLRDFYTRYYQPDNAVLVVSGHFDEKKAVALIDRYFGALKRPERRLTATYTEEPPQDGERTVVLRRVGTVGALGAVYHVPAGSHPDFPAVEVLADALGDEPNGRLYQALVVPKLATDVSAFAFNWHDPGALQVSARAEPDKLDAARDALLNALESLADRPVTDQEVERSKLRFRRRFELLMASPDRVATTLSDWISKGDWRLFFLHRDRMEAVTAADVNRVAGRYLTRNNRTVGVYVPSAQAERAVIPAAPAVKGQVEGYKGRAAVAAGEAFDPTPANVEARVARSPLGGVKAAYLPKKTRGETVTLQLTLRYGNEDSLAPARAAADLLGPMLARGTTRHTRQQLQDEFARLGSTVSVSGGLGTVSAAVVARRPTLDATLKLLAEVLREPAFPADEFEVLKRERVKALEEQRTEPTALASRLLRRKLAPFGRENVRYVPTIEEEVAELNEVSLDKVKRLYADQVGAAAGELAAVGDFDPEAVRAALGPALEGWSAKVPYRRVERPAVTDVPASKDVILTPDKANAMYVAGLSAALTDADPDYAAMTVGNFLLGGGTLSSRLGNRVRQKEGLSYGVASQFSASPLDPSAGFLAYAICNPANIDKVDAAVRDELNRFVEQGPAAEELEEGKRAYLRQLQVQRTNDGGPSGLAATLAGGLYAGRTFDYYADLEQRIAALKPEDVKAAFRRRLELGRLVVVEAGDFPQTSPAK